MTTNAATILACFGPTEELTNEDIHNRTGLLPGSIGAEVSRLRDAGKLEYADGQRRRPVVHRLSGEAKAKALHPDSIVALARHTQPTSVFNLGRSA